MSHLREAPPLEGVVKDILLADHRDRRTLHMGGATCKALAGILLEQHALYQGWLSDPASSMAQREVATLRVIALEEVLRQLGELPEEVA